MNGTFPLLPEDSAAGPTPVPASLRPHAPGKFLLLPEDSPGPTPSPTALPGGAGDPLTQALPAHGSIVHTPSRALELLTNYGLPTALMIGGAMIPGALGAEGVLELLLGMGGSGLGNLTSDALSHALVQRTNPALSQPFGARERALSFGAGALSEAGARFVPSALSHALDLPGMSEAVRTARLGQPAREAVGPAVQRAVDEAVQTVGEKSRALEAKAVAREAPAAANTALQDLLAARHAAVPSAGPPLGLEPPPPGFPGSPVTPELLNAPLEHEEVEQQTSMRKGINAAKDRVKKFYGNLFDKYLSRFDDHLVDAAPLRDAAEAERSAAAARGVILEAPTRRLLGRLDSLGIEPPREVVDMGGEHVSAARLELLRGLRREAAELSVRNFPGPFRGENHAIAVRAERLLSDTMASVGAVVPQPVKDHYFVLSRLLEMTRKTGKAIDPAQLDSLFTGPGRQLTRAVAKIAGPESRAVIRDALAGYIEENNLTARQVGQTISEKTLRALFGDSELGHVRFWLNNDARTATWAHLFDADPVAAERARSSVEIAMAPVKRKVLTALRNGAARRLAALGGPGPALAAELRSLSPEQAVVRIRQLLASNVLSLPALEQAAEREALASRRAGPLTRQLLRRLGWILPVGIGAAVTVGRTSTFIVGSLVLGAALSPVLGSRALLRAMVRNPRYADLLIREMDKSPTALGAQSVGRLLARLFSADVTRHAEKNAGFGPVPPAAPAPPPTPEDLGPEGGILGGP